MPELLLKFLTIAPIVGSTLFGCWLVSRHTLEVHDRGAASARARGCPVCDDRAETEALVAAVGKNAGDAP